MLKSLKEDQKKLIEGYKTSTLKKEEYCKQNNIAVHQLNYLIEKERRLREESSNKISFVKIPTPQEYKSIIEITVGKSIIKVEQGFNEELLLKVIKVLSNA